VFCFVFSDYFSNQLHIYVLLMNGMTKSGRDTLELALGGQPYGDLEGARYRNRAGIRVGQEQAMFG
jgi:hypothetical protein